eukprot:g63920.t1
MIYHSAASVSPMRRLPPAPPRCLLLPPPPSSTHSSPHSSPHSSTQISRHFHHLAPTVSRAGPGRSRGRLCGLSTPSPARHLSSSPPSCAQKSPHTAAHSHSTKAFSTSGLNSHTKSVAPAAATRAAFSRALPDCLRWDLSEASQKLQSGQVTSRELTEACLQQIENSHAALNCFVAVSKDEALQQADRSDQRRKAGQSQGPLDGVPLAIKDNFTTQGVRTTAASKILSNFVPPYDATPVARLRQAGAVLLGKTNMDEFGMGSFTDKSIFGQTVNPYSYSTLYSGDLLSAGGSSGGSAAAVASFCCYGALGSDTGGSVRLPASYCGLVGVKPTYGTTSRHGLIAYGSSFDVPGVLCRSVEDAALLLGAIYGADHANDSTSREGPPIVPPSVSHIARQQLKGLKVGVPKALFAEDISEAVLEVWLSALDQLKACGLSPQFIKWPSFELALPAYYTLVQAEAASNLSRYDGIRYGLNVDPATLSASQTGPDDDWAGTASQPDHTDQEQEQDEQGGREQEAGMLDSQTLHRLITANRTHGFGREVQKRILGGTYVLSAAHYSQYISKAQSVRRQLLAEYEQLFKQEGLVALATPTALTPALSFEQIRASSAANPISDYLNDALTVSANLAGLPALSVPAGTCKTTGLPLGLQLTGATLGENVLLAIARLLESTQPRTAPF